MKGKNQLRRVSEIDFKIVSKAMDPTALQKPALKHSTRLGSGSFGKGQFTVLQKRIYRHVGPRPLALKLAGP